MTVARPVLRYHGGKWMLAPWIIEHMPSHRVYTEAFGGAASVLMRKPRAHFVEIYNDLDSEICNVFRVLRQQESAQTLQHLLTITPFSREEFETSYEQTNDPIEQARRTIVRSFMGFGSDSASGAKTGFRANGNRQGSHPSRDWVNYPANLQYFTQRLREVVIESRPAIEVISQHDAPTTLHYCDPPYVLETRSKHVTRDGKGYRHEMTNEQHAQLAEVLKKAKGMVLVSGYANDLYDRELFPDWVRVERQALADGALERTEVLWMNAACAAALESQEKQKRMFA